MNDTSRAIRIHRDADLGALNTFGVRVRAPWLVDVSDAHALPEAFMREPLAGSTPLVLGGGSNLLFAGAPDVPVLRLTAAHVRVESDDGDSVVLYADAGVEWHALVMHSVELGLHGLENLALIPGTTGAAPIQNIGAYGVEVGQRIEAVHAYEPATSRFVRIDAAGCAFAYRDSLFKRSPDRYIVTGVEFRLHRVASPVLGYAGIAEELDQRGIAAPNGRDVAEAVIAIRRRKLPDPAKIGNAGSFFKNPIVPTPQAAELQALHPGLPVFGAGDGTSKLSAAWLIDSLGFKGVREGDAGIAESHALVLVNHGNASGMELLALARRIAEAVHGAYDVRLEPEPRIVGGVWDA